MEENLDQTCHRIGAKYHSHDLFGSQFGKNWENLNSDVAASLLCLRNHGSVSHTYEWSRAASANVDTHSYILTFLNLGQ